MERFETVLAQQHPLLNPVVLKLLFKFPLAFEDLQKARLVCRDWYQASLKQWRSLATINLGPAASSESSQLSVLNYFEYLRSSNDFYQFKRYPFQKYTIIGVDFTQYEYSIYRWMDRDNSLKLWDFVGPLIKRLKFKQCTFHGFSHFFKELLCENLYNLQSLSIYECNSVPEQQVGLLDIIHYQATYISINYVIRNVTLQNLEIVGLPPTDLGFLIFGIAPNIKVLKFSSGNCNSTEWSDLYSIFANISAAKVLVANDQLDIKEFQLNLNISRSEPETPAFLMRNMELPVERVFFSIDPLNNDICFKTGFYNLSSLKILELCQLFDYQPIGWDIKEGFGSLKELYFYRFCFSVLNVLNWMPNLEVLYIDMKLYSSLNRVLEATSEPKVVADALRMSNGKLPKDIITRMTTISLPLTAMKRFHIDQDLHVDTWKKVSECMPNLETLEAVLSLLAFQNVCSHLPKLKGLVLLHGSKISDSVLTGVTPDDRNPDNITALKELETFQIQRFCGKPDCRTPPECRLGDLSIYRGFLEMKNLLTVTIYASQKMTIGADTALRKHIPNVQVIHNYTKAKSGHNGECCKIKDFLSRYPKRTRDQL